MEDSSLVINEEETQIFGVFDGHGGYQVSKFVSKYFYKVLTELTSYKKNLIEKALIETFLKLDLILKLENVNKALKSFEFRNDSNFDIAFEFLKFCNLSNNEINIKIPHSKSSDTLASLKDFYYSNNNIISPIKHNSSNDIINDLENTPQINKNEGEFSEIFDSESTIDNDHNEKPYFLKENEEIYSFGGVILDNKSHIHPNLVAFSMGTTANVAFIRNGICYIANVGDSMAVLYKNGKALKLNTEHKVLLGKEKERILKSGSGIYNGRIDGRINLSRAIGDFMFKRKNALKDNEQPIISYPEINKFKITSDMEFIVLACDGIWDCVEIQGFCEYVSTSLKEKIPLQKILKDLFDRLIYDNKKMFGGTDNMTCTIVVFNH